MLESKIDFLRQELDNQIRNGASFQDVYTLSISLDELIVAFYVNAFVNK
ncbi:MAG: Spo0E family sporulation regulatory protein-aspartic acid phosphatase [Ignavibacteriales bacterium]